MRSLLLGAVAALGLAPAFASAAVILNIENLTVTDTSAQQTVFVTLFGSDATSDNERMNAYTIAVNGTGNGFGGANGVRFQVPAGSNFGAAGRPTAPHPYVFGGLDPVPPVENFSSTAGRLQFGATAINQEDEVNVGTGLDGFIRLPVIIPAGATPGVYTLTIDPAATSLAGLGAPIVATPGQAGTITVVPEPASLGLIALGGLFALRRRRLA
jgi:hypothetical protein